MTRLRNWTSAFVRLAVLVGAGTVVVGPATAALLTAVLPVVG